MNRLVPNSDPHTCTHPRFLARNLKNTLLSYARRARCTWDSPFERTLASLGPIQLQMQISAVVREA